MNRMRVFAAAFWGATQANLATALWSQPWPLVGWAAELPEFAPVMNIEPPQGRTTANRGKRRCFLACAAALSGPPLVLVMLMMSVFGGSARAETLYWDTDRSTAGNNASTGANLGGSDLWSTADTNWWNTSFGTLRVWTGGNEAVFWGTAGTVTAATVSANSLAFKTTGYSVNSGTLTMIGTASVHVDAGVSATLGSTIAGANTLWKIGAGTLVLSNPANINTANSSAGGWRIEGGGTLRIMADGSLGAPLPATNEMTFTVDPAAGCVFYRLLYP